VQKILPQNPSPTISFKKSKPYKISPQKPFYLKTLPKTPKFSPHEESLPRKNSLKILLQKFLTKNYVFTKFALAKTPQNSSSQNLFFAKNLSPTKSRALKTSKNFLQKSLLKTLFPKTPKKFISLQTN
jgi:hypothetical protein